MKKFNIHATNLIFCFFILFIIPFVSASGHGSSCTPPGFFCDSGLICDSDGTVGFGYGGCCYSNENWDYASQKCNLAIYGTVYTVTTNPDGTFSQQLFTNGEIVFKIRDHDPLSSGITTYDKTYTDSNGNFYFNPEWGTNVVDWNQWWLGFNWQVDNVYAVQGNEIIGEWTNDFNNGFWSGEEQGYRLGSQTRHQIVRIHTDMPYWRKSDISGSSVQVFSLSNSNKKEVNNAPALGFSTRNITATKNTLSAMSNSNVHQESGVTDQKLVSIRITGNLSIKSSDNYILSTNLPGGVRLTVDSVSVIDNWNDNPSMEERNGSISLTLGNHAMVLEYYKYVHSPDYYIYLESESDNNKVELSPSIFQRTGFDFQYYAESKLNADTLSYTADNQVTSLSSVGNIVDNSYNYQVSFLEDPKVYDSNKNYNYNQQPLVLVHGLNGVSGYWNFWYDYLTNLGYTDIWQVYYPNDQSNKYSAALIGDSLSYIKQNYNSKNVDVITHSMGGLVTLGYIEGLGVTPNNILINFKNDIRKVVFIAPPFHGSYLTNRIINGEGVTIPGLVCELILKILNIDNFNKLAPAYSDLLVGSQYLWNLNNRSLNSGVSYTVITGDHQIPCASPESIDSDGFVSVSSASLLDKNVPLIVVNQDHGSELGYEYNRDLPFTYVNITYLSQIVDGILKGYSESSLKSHFQFANEYYINPANPQSNPSAYGAMLIKSNTNANFSLKNNLNFYSLQSAPYTGTYYYYGYEEKNANPAGLMLPSGNYSVYVNGQDTNQDVEVKGAQTTMKEIDLPLDIDGDGVPDSQDACPNTYGTYCNGCQIPSCPSGYSASCPSSGQPVCICNGPCINLNNFPEYAKNQTIIKELPDNANISLKFYNFDSGERVWERNYTITKGNVIEGEAENPDIEIILASKYVPGVSDLCNTIKEAKQNNDIAFWTNLNLIDFLWKYKEMIKYKDCFLIEDINDTINPNVTLLSPADNTYSSTLNQNFTFKATDNLGVKNATLHIYNTTGLFNITYITSNISTNAINIIITLQEGTYKWGVSVWDWAGNTYISKNNTLKVCIPNMQNTFFSNWSNISCLSSNLMNQTRNSTQYDLNSCRGSQNKTIYEYRANLSCEAINSLLGLLVNSPKNLIYNQTSITFNLTVNKSVNEIDYIDYNDTRPRLNVLCKNCNGYGSKTKNIKSFRDGQHNITFIAVNGTTNDTLNVSFFVDSKIPSVSTTIPQNRKYTNGSDFFIKYTENNLQDIILFYGNETLDKAYCLSGTNKNCSFGLNLSSYDNQSIIYRFKIVDIANNTKMSSNTTVYVDTTSPKIVIFQNDTNGRYVTFSMVINETNFNGVNYIDYNDTRPRWNTLCSSLRYGSCIVKKYFQAGNHNVTIRVLDKAGNSAEKSLFFKII